MKSAIAIAAMGVAEAANGCPANGRQPIGRRREYELYVPPGTPANAPLVVAFHGIASSPLDIEGKMDFATLADKEGFILAYPYGNGVPKSFNGAGCCSDWSVGGGNDDVQLARDIVLDLTKDDCADINNVFGIGFSNGGFMQNRIACQAGEREPGVNWFRAVSSHSGLLGKNDSPGQSSYCNPSIPVPIISFAADDDGVVGFDGKGVLEGQDWKSFYDTQAVHENLHNCGDNRQLTFNSDTTLCFAYDTCPVEYCVISRGLQHNWAGQPDLRGSRPDDVDATPMIWDFFVKQMDNQFKQTERRAAMKAFRELASGKANEKAAEQVTTSAIA